MATKLTYVRGDAKKTPVDPEKQANGTVLVRVTETGREVCFTVQNDINGGTTVPAAPPPAKVKEPAPEAG